MVFFESPQRLRQTISDLLEILGDRKAAIARELTKKFEEVKRGRLSELALWVRDNEARGEITLVVEGRQSGVGLWDTIGDGLGFLLELSVAALARGMR